LTLPGAIKQYNKYDKVGDECSRILETGEIPVGYVAVKASKNSLNLN
jgi:hypothetical protein